MDGDSNPMGRILIADDHDALRRGLARGLGEAGHEVEEAADHARGDPRDGRAARSNIAWLQGGR